MEIFTFKLQIFKRNVSIIILYGTAKKITKQRNHFYILVTENCKFEQLSATSGGIESESKVNV